MTGLCRYWHPRKRFGRILGDDNREYWVEKSKLRGRHALRIGDSVTFIGITDHPKGPRATDVRVVEVPGPGRRR